MGGGLVVALTACSKEQRLIRQLEGQWQWQKIEEAPVAHIGISDSVQHFFRFLACRRAYTSSCRCVYSMEKSGVTPVTLVDTLIYDLKSDEMSITQFLSQKTAPNSSPEGILNNRRFRVVIKGSILELRNVQIPAFKIVAQKVP
ncbi:MAG: hypothetical protein N2110_04390 [Flavobacteriales bacterium]|nr:hypothetical protein [Flavobacteriales bacterium]MCX7768249.1 hypothetical protein [Flavobacteriales bacterium]MDW8410590.1 hypothetical protein [Flavobacteriales bacterium]